MRTLLAFTLTAMAMAASVAASASTAELDLTDDPSNTASLQALSPLPADITPAYLGHTDGSIDVDYYTFTASEGDVFNIWIQTATFDSFLAVWGPLPNYTLQEWDDDVLDSAGNITSMNAHITTQPLAAGTYIVGVTNSGNPFDVTASGPVLLSVSQPSQFTFQENGSYELMATRQPATALQQASTLQAAIKIKTASKMQAALLHGHGQIPVAILSTPTFSAMSVDANPKTLTFGAKGDEQSLIKCNWTAQDLNGDGKPDRMCFFDSSKTNFSETQLTGHMNGVTKAGQHFQGHESLKVNPPRKQP